MKIVILGAGGMLGHKMYSVLSGFYPETYAVFRKPTKHYAPFGIFNLDKCRGEIDVRDEKSLDSVLSTVQPDVVINCVGLTTRKLGGQRESDVVLVNSVLPNRLKEWATQNSKKVIHFSTDCVFSGDGGPYTIESHKDAEDLYGLSKSIGEVGAPGVLTIRSSIIGLEIEGKTELLEWFLAQSGKTIRGFRKVMYSGVTTSTMSDVVLQLLKSGKEFGGIHQLASAPISKYELLKTASEVFAMNVKIEPVDEPVHSKVLVQSTFFNERGIHPAPWREQLEVVASDRRRKNAAA